MGVKPNFPHLEGPTPGNFLFGYDEGLGIDPLHIDYIRQNHLIQSRISPTPCYLLQQEQAGLPIGYSTRQVAPLDDQLIQDGNRFKLILWQGGVHHPDTRPYVNAGSGNIFIYLNAVPATRVLSPDDIKSDTEFAVVENKTLLPYRVEVWFNVGYNPTSFVTFYYMTWEEGVEDTSVQRGDSTNQSLFGWKQYVNSRSDVYQRANQILVRFPINLRDVSITDEGRVILENRDSWMVWFPYVNDFDMLILDADDSPDGLEYRYEIVNSRDSIVQRQLTLQFFKLNLLERTDDRYAIPFVKVA